MGETRLVGAHAPQRDMRKYEYGELFDDLLEETTVKGCAVPLRLLMMDLNAEVWGGGGGRER